MNWLPGFCELITPIMGIAIDSHHMNLSSLTSIDNNISIQALDIINLENNTSVHELTLFNSSMLKQKIKEFIVKHDLQNAITVISLHDKTLYEHLGSTQDHCLLSSDQYCLKSTVLTLPDHTEQHYSSALAYYQLFGYQLLASDLGLDLVSITTRTMTAYHVFKNYKQLWPTHTVITTSTELNSYVQSHIDHTLIDANGIDNVTFVTALGLYYIGKNYELA